MKLKGVELDLFLESLPTVDKVGIKEFLNKEFEISCRNGVTKLRPVRVYTSYVKGRGGVYVIWGIFICPDGSIIKKALGKYVEYLKSKIEKDH